MRDDQAGERIHALEAFRGLGALMIVLYHAYQHSRSVATYVYEGTPLHALLRSLDSGVALFMVLSGFVVFLPLARACIQRDARPSVRGFLIRRAIRIVPLYYIAIVVVWTSRYTGSHEQWLDLLLHLTFTQVFDSTYIFWTIGPAWSLAVEVQFYVLIAALTPAFYGASGRLATPAARTNALLAACMLIIAASLAYKIWAYYVAQRPELDYAIYYSLPAKADLLALGMLLAVLVARSTERKPMPAALRGGLLSVGLLICAGAIVWRASVPLVDQFFHSLCGLAALCVLAATVGSPAGAPLTKAMSSRVPTALGLISYSVYLWHEPIMILLSDRRLLNFEHAAAFPLATLIFVALTLIGGAVSYAVIEHPTQHLRHLFTRDGKPAERYAG